MKLKLRSERWKGYGDPTKIVAVVLLDKDDQPLGRFKLRPPNAIEKGVTTLELKLDIDVLEP
jgi:hypothetical protein